MQRVSSMDVDEASEDMSLLHIQSGKRQTIKLASAVLFGVHGHGISGCPLENRKTKIVCTIGPVTQSVEALSDLLRAGMNVARMNFSHGDHEYHGQTVKNIRAAVKATGLPCAILLDTKGPEVRTGKLVGGRPVMLQDGARIILNCNAPEGFLGTAEEIAVDYRNMPKVLTKGDTVKIDDGLISIRVDRTDDEKIYGTVLNGQELGQNKGVNLPGIAVDLPPLTPKDEADLRFGVEMKVDFCAPSFINRANDVKEIRKVFGKDGAYIKIISKIESAEGLRNFAEILEESDGIMVARGDLGVEIPIEKVCMAQKTMISLCHSAGKPVITATQMLESMVKNPRPTRAEATDVANAVFDGTDCVMLSGETAKGAFPCEAVKVMANICRTSESALDHRTLFLNMLSRAKADGDSQRLRTDAVTSSAVKTAIDLNAALIFALTDSGRTASSVSKYRPPVPIITVTPNELTARQSLVHSGLWPIVVDANLDDGHRYAQAVKVAVQRGWCASGDCVIVVSGHYNVSGSAHQTRVLDVD
eukprot:260811_1